MMEAARTSETLVNFYQTTRHYNPEDSHLCTHRRENLKSYLIPPQVLLGHIAEPTSLYDPEMFPYAKRDARSDKDEM
jgi:hypothetical protein